MVKKILLGLAAILAVLVIGFVIVVAVQPSTFRVERTATMAAPAEEIFAQVNDFHRWEDWSPWLDVKIILRTFPAVLSRRGAY